LRLGKSFGWVLAALVALLAMPAAAGADQVLAGAAIEDATWHVGASAGQYASGDELDTNDAGGAGVSLHSQDPHSHSIRRNPSYGVQSRLSARAIVVQGPGGKFALVKNDLYIPQDLLWRRTAQILQSKGIGIDRHNLTMTSTHDHSSPMYSSTGWGVWVFQDVFDFRFFEYQAQAQARAVERANAAMVPVKVGASVSQYDFPQRNVPGPSTADDGTPAGFPNDYTDHDLMVVRFERLDGKGTVANLVNYAVHPEDNEGNDLISGDYVTPLQRMADRATGGVNIYTQGAVGNTEPEDNRWHNVHERAYFSHAQYAQSEFKARGIAGALVDTYKDIAANTPENPGRFVPYQTDFGSGSVRFEDRWFPGPASHPYPGISSCRTDAALAGDPRAPIVGFPDCAPASDYRKDYYDSNCKDFGGPDERAPPGLQDRRHPAHRLLVRAVGRPVEGHQDAHRPHAAEPARGLRLDSAVRRHRQRHVELPAPERPAEDLDGAEGDGPRADPERREGLGRPRLRAAGREPTDPHQIKGNYTHDDTNENPAHVAEANQNATKGFGLTVAIGMANDYNGYIATYREYQRGDHYRKALTAWGPHSSDYMATRLVKLGRSLKDGSDPFPFVPGNPGGLDVVSGLTPGEWPGGDAKVTADLQNNENRATTIGNFATGGMAAYERSLPDDLKAEAVRQPDDVERFGASAFTWVGGSNYSDNPQVKVQRFTDGAWTDWADQSGELPITLKFPPTEDRPSYRIQGSRFEWTAHFEAFVSRYDLMDRPISTPAGSYRFVVAGKRQQGGGPVDYKLVSREFQVKPWTGITVESLGTEGGQTSFKVGPRRSLDCNPGGGPKLAARLGPIDYPDTWQANHPAKIPYIGPERRCFRDPAAPTDPDKVEWYCVPPDGAKAKARGCSFRPWLDVGDLDRVVFTFVTKSGKVERVAGSKQGGAWVADRKLKSGEGVYVEAGDACDAYGDYNGKASSMVGNANAAPDKPPAGFSCVPKPVPGEVPGEPGGGSGSGGGGSGSGNGLGGSNPLGLPPTKNCVDQRRFSFKIHQPPRRRIVAVNVFVNGKRKLSTKGRKITRVTIKKLPSSTKTYRVRIIAITNRGDRVISDRRYRGCKKSRPTTHVEHPKKKKKK
jgi:hypothetical protein